MLALGPSSWFSKKLHAENWETEVAGWHSSERTEYEVYGSDSRTFSILLSDLVSGLFSGEEGNRRENPRYEDIDFCVVHGNDNVQMPLLLLTLHYYSTTTEYYCYYCY